MRNSIIIAGNHIVVLNNDSKFIKRYEYQKGQCSFLYGQWYVHVSFAIMVCLILITCVPNPAY